MTEPPITMSKEEARLRLETLSPVREAILEIINDISKWLYASLLTVNTGGFVALLNKSANLSVWQTKAAFAGYFVGILCAFTLGYVTVIRGEEANKWIQHQTSVLIAMITGSEPKQEDATEATRLYEKMRRDRWQPHALGLVSAISFLAASTFFAFSLQ